MHAKVFACAIVGLEGVFVEVSIAENVPRWRKFSWTISVTSAKAST